MTTYKTVGMVYISGLPYLPNSGVQRVDKVEISPRGQDGIDLYM